MPLDTQTFGIKRHWLAVALNEVPRTPDIFSGNQISLARKAFLAGSNQLKAIRSWLTNSEIIRSSGRHVELTDQGKLMAAKDIQARRAWTWWLFHLHLCTNKDSFPYTTIFTTLEAEGGSWLTQDDLLDALVSAARQAGSSIEKESVKSYFAGVDNALKPGMPLYSLGLVERRMDSDGSPRLRRKLARPSQYIIAYATLLFHRRYHANQPTVEMRLLLQRGLGKSLGLRDSDVREELQLINQAPGLSRYIQYRHAVNLDSVQFTDSSELLLRKFASQAYMLGDVRWQ